ncbi:hypothetical protein [Prosthecobacter vanneervenii]|uniref:N-formylglutamate amidohydrolase n=1 Tax=Prosthecobacter vanneervenii TaxID=48466 RepID=A0A7W7YDI5_9BACT|nr:hypothetical protein [Prosthecobacter vanneervenii]MBB5034183.1 hypothetical protein [Prosthecobacter vanneervenii]
MRILFFLFVSAAALQAQTAELETYIEVRHGTLPIVLTVPHGGSLKPANVLARRYGVTGTDSNTIPLAEMIIEELESRYGARPHAIISRLSRTRLDPNRDLEEAAQGDPTAVAAWHRFHDSAQKACDTVMKKSGLGLLLDIHGHRHLEQRVELGYLVKADILKHSDAELNADTALIASTCIRDLDKRSPQTFAELLRGPQSLGGLLEFRGFRSLPSPTRPSPGFMAGYFSGVYDVAAHGSRSGGTVSAIQLECPWNNVRDTPENQRRFAVALADSLGIYFEVHFGRKLK